MQRLRFLDTCEPLDRLQAKACLVRSLQSMKVEAAESEAAMMLQAIGLDSSPVAMLSSAMLQTLEHYLSQRNQGVPLAYVLRWWGFGELTFNIQPGVLIPRSDSYALVEYALSLKHLKGGALLDLGCGSGALGLSIAFYRQIESLYLLDQNPLALETTALNAECLGLTGCNILSSDGLEAVQHLNFDLIISNPPYLANDDPELKALTHEPEDALLGGEEGLDYYKAWTPRAFDLLRPGGTIIFEHGASQASAVQALLTQAGLIQPISIYDLAGHARGLAASKPK